jgi:hypothetical protein
MENQKRTLRSFTLKYAGLMFEIGLKHGLYDEKIPHKEPLTEKQAYRYRELLFKAHQNRFNAEYNKLKN